MTNIHLSRLTDVGTRTLLNNKLNDTKPICHAQLGEAKKQTGLSVISLVRTKWCVTNVREGRVTMTLPASRRGRVTPHASRFPRRLGPGLMLPAYTVTRVYSRFDIQK